MLELPMLEMVIFILVLLVYLAAAVIGYLQLRTDREKYRRFMLPLVCLAITLEAVILVFRAAAIKAVPLTGLFESMIVLTIVFGMIYLALSIAIQQVWFSSVMVWVIFLMVIMAGFVARPASEPHAVVATPWAIAHGIAMILGGAAIAFATANAFLYLFSKRKLKQKKVMQVLGKVPNIEKLETMNLFGVRAGLVLITIGLISGFGLALLPLGISLTEWLTDGKIICIFAAWVLLGVILILNRLLLLKSSTKAYLTIVAFVFVLFAILGVTILGTTQHDFSQYLSITPVTK